MPLPTPLWLCLGLPTLPLEALGLGDSHAACVLTSGGRDPRVLLGNRPAYALGIAPGLRVGAAYALGDIKVYTRRESKERSAIESLAVWCGQFTSLVSLAPPDGLLLEIGKSLALFQGIEKLAEGIRAGVAELGYQAILAIAPTPLGAIFFARARQAVCITEVKQLLRPLSRLPLEVLGVDERVAEALRGLGLRDLGGCLRLPRDGLARRFGPEFVSLLDRTLGRQLDPRPIFEPPARFARLLDLPYEVDDAQALRFAARRLLLELTGFLRARGAGTQRLDWRFVHRERRETTLHIELVSATRDIDRLVQLLHIRLDQLELPEPVRALKLIVNDLCPLAGATLALLPDAQDKNHVQSPAFLERLRARLGRDSIRGLRLISDHRPEAAWCFCSPGEASPLFRTRPRPLWLLKQPQPLAVQEGRPRLRGPLKLLGHSERIEGGWWDGHPIARDYFVARNPAGGYFWVFREIEGNRGWFVHGVFD
ncbi:MAG: Y-family DNA polymerase [Gammaproteobacteria bacterium]